MATTTTFDFNFKNRLVRHNLHTKSGFTATFVENGGLYEMYFRDILVNLYRANPLTSGASNINLRIFRNNNIEVYPINAQSARITFEQDPARMVFRQELGGLVAKAELMFADEESAFYWTVKVENPTDENVKVDIVCAQDLALSNRGAVMCSELYQCQYLDLAEFNDSQYGSVLCARRNTFMGGRFPWMMMGCFDGSDGFLTDGYQLYGDDYLAGNLPAALLQENLPNKIAQYEYCMPTLKSKAMNIDSKGTGEVVFFMLCEEDHPEASSKSDLEKIAKAKSVYDAIAPRGEENFYDLAQSILAHTPVFNTRDLTDDEVGSFFSSDRRNVEEDNGQLNSFFYDNDNKHVVLKRKELKVKRKHGHILKTGRNLLPEESTLSTTCWMNGVFNAQTTAGHTWNNKFISLRRNFLNVMHDGGQRLQIMLNGQWHWLDTPSAFEMGLNHARWVYVNDQISIEVVVWASIDDDAIVMEVTSNGEPLEFKLITNITLGDLEFEHEGKAEYDAESGTIRFVPAASAYMTNKYPETVYMMGLQNKDVFSSVDSANALYADGDGRGLPAITLTTKATKNFSVVMGGGILGDTSTVEKLTAAPITYAASAAGIEAYWNEIAGGHKFSDTANLGIVNEILPWFVHNAIVHMAIPRGLEQFAAGAWGTRDVCQGPIELLVVLGRFEEIKEILRLVFKNQYDFNGNWPQAFMFDRYAGGVGHSHGDVIHWPLKAVCDYLEATGDFEFLNEEICWMGENGTFTAETATLAKHIEVLVDAVKKSYIQGTHLPCYGDGDWNDSLQPAETSMKKDMVSGWTVALCYQTIDRYAKICKEAGLADLAASLTAENEAIKADYNRLLIADDTISGFIRIHEGGDVDYLLHPNDKKTGIKYRLLPMIRGMISEIFTPDQAQKHYDLIQNNLRAVDGVRLMSSTPLYQGGVETFFQRSESASFFGREVGLQYMHAHIRYCEAMAKLGRADDLYKGIQQVIPVGITDTVKGAVARQSNAYFSSSDAEFATRYEAKEGFQKVFSGDVALNGGWRVYSSGPGIYMYQLIGNFAGIRSYFGDYLFDPVIAKELSGMTISTAINGAPVEIKYTCQEGSFAPKKIILNGAEVEFARSENPYREGGALIKKELFNGLLKSDSNTLEIVL